MFVRRKRRRNRSCSDCSASSGRGVAHRRWAIVLHATRLYGTFPRRSAGWSGSTPSLDEARRVEAHANSAAAASAPMSSPDRRRMLLVFMSALGSFSAPYVFGGGIRVLSTQIVASKLNGNLGLAYAETAVLALAAVAGLLVLRRFERRRSYAMSGKGRQTRTVARAPAARALLSALAFATVAVLSCHTPCDSGVVRPRWPHGHSVCAGVPSTTSRMATEPTLLVPIRKRLDGVDGDRGERRRLLVAAYLIVLRRLRAAAARVLVALPGRSHDRDRIVLLDINRTTHSPRRVVVGRSGSSSGYSFASFRFGTRRGSLKQMDPHSRRAPGSLG